MRGSQARIIWCAIPSRHRLTIGMLVMLTLSALPDTSPISPRTSTNGCRYRSPASDPYADTYTAVPPGSQRVHMNPNPALLNQLANEKFSEVKLVKCLVSFYLPPPRSLVHLRFPPPSFSLSPPPLSLSLSLSSPSLSLSLSLSSLSLLSLSPLPSPPPPLALPPSSRVPFFSSLLPPTSSESASLVPRGKDCMCRINVA